MNKMKNRKLRNLELYRKRNNLSQIKLAEKIGIKRYRIADWEQGRSEPSISMLKKLSDTLGVSIETLIDQNSLKIEESSDPTILQIIKK
ncbi:MAG TPA: hypothetical protein DDW20_00505 [Firmicutes bacterium]|nr:hypothetical protein [Bacillota bacterium]